MSVRTCTYAAALFLSQPGVSHSYLFVPVSVSIVLVQQIRRKIHLQTFQEYSSPYSIQCLKIILIEFLFDSRQYREAGEKGGERSTGQNRTGIPHRYIVFVIDHTTRRTLLVLVSIYFT